MKFLGNDYRELLSRLEKHELTIGGRENLEITRILRATNTSNLQTVEHKFPYTSQYSHMRLLESLQHPGVGIVEKIYGIQTGGLGHSMDLNSKQARQVARHIKSFHQQLTTIGINVAVTKNLSIIPFENDFWGVKFQQEFINGKNLMEVFQQSVIYKNRKVQSKLLRSLLKIIHLLTSFRTSDNKLFPYTPKTIFDSHIGLDAKPQNFMIDFGSTQNHVILVDIVYPSNRVKDGTFSILDVMPSAVEKDPGWRYLPIREAHKFGLYCKIALELAGGCSDVADPIPLLHQIEEEVLKYIYDHEPHCVFAAIKKEMKSQYSTYRQVQGRGESFRFSKIWANLSPTTPVSKSINVPKILNTLSPVSAEPFLVV